MLAFPEWAERAVFAHRKILAFLVPTTHIAIADAEGESRHFSLTPLAEPLQSDVPGSKRALALMSGDEQFRAWSEIEYSIQTGKIAFDKVFGKPIFGYLGDHPDKARIFDAAMVGIHGRESNAILDAYDFSGIGVVADIGGGNGSQLTDILQKHKAMKGNGQPVHLSHRKDDVLLVSFPQKGMNFTVTIGSADEMAEALLMILTYSSSVAADDRKEAPPE